MIEYDPGKWWGWHKLIQLHGSVVQDVLPHCLVATFLVLWAHFSDAVIFPKSPYAHQIFTFGLSFLVIMRTNLSYSRYWEGISELVAMWSKWTDAVSQIIAFDELATGPAAASGLKFRAHVIHIMSLMSATIVVNFQEGGLDELDQHIAKFETPDEQEEPPHREITPIGNGSRGSAFVSVAPDATSAREVNRSSQMPSIEIGDHVTVVRANHTDHNDLVGSIGQVVRAETKDGTVLVHFANGTENWFTSKALQRCEARAASHQEDADMELLSVIHGMSPAECAELQRADAQGCATHYLMQKVVRLASLRHKAGGLAAPPPIVSRIFQEFSNGFLAFQSARKVSTIPFPFPYAQIVQYLQLAFVLSCPFVVVAFVDDLGFQMFFTFLGVFTFCSLNAVASQLEDPFGHDANDLPLRKLHNHYVCVLSQLHRSKLSEADLDCVASAPDKKEAAPNDGEQKGGVGESEMMAQVEQKVAASGGTLLHEDLVREMFVKLDKNRNGVLDHDEIKSLCAQAGIFVAGDNYDNMLKLIDPDCTGEVTFEELWDWYSARQRKRALFSATQLGVLRGPTRTATISGPLAPIGSPRSQLA